MTETTTPFARMEALEAEITRLSAETASLRAQRDFYQNDVAKQLQARADLEARVQQLEAALTEARDALIYCGTYFEKYFDATNDDQARGVVIVKAALTPRARAAKDGDMSFSKAYLKDKKVEVGEMRDGSFGVYIESRQWGTISTTGKTVAEAIAKLLDKIDMAQCAEEEES